MLGLGGLTALCLVVATALPFLVGPDSISRPSSSARLAIVSPRHGETIHGTPASIAVELRLDGGTIVPGSSLHLVPNEGHIHLYLDGSLVSMTGLESQISASPGQHVLRAEFVAVDHEPFQPRVIASVAFQVEP